MAQATDLLGAVRQRAREHLVWARFALAQLPPDAERQREVASRLAVAEQRIADENLYIAVIGETSSGKTSLLNALLRRRLLPSSSLVTTRTTLAIRYQERGEGVRLLAPEGIVNWPSIGFANWAQDRLGCVPTSLETVLRHLLTGRDAEQIADLELGLPVRLLGDRMVLLDTPGFSVATAGHREAAIAAARRSDLVLVVVPATAPGSRTLLDFITGPLAGQANRCAFVMTKTDLVPVDEHAEVMAAFVARLQAAGIAHPVVLTCRPELALRELADSGPALLEFRDVESRLASMAANRRNEAMDATLAEVLSDLINAVAQDAAKRRAALADDEAELHRLALPDFDQFLAEWGQRACGRVDRALDSALAIGAGARAAQELTEAVRAAVAGDQIGQIKAAASKVNVLVESALRRDADLAVSAVTAGVSVVLDRAAAELMNRFADQFAVLTQLAGRPRGEGARVPDWQVSLPAPDLTSVNRKFTEIGQRLGSNTEARRTGGAAAGAAFGLLFGPLGVGVGAVLGYAIGNPSNDELRARFLEQAVPLIDEGCREVDEAVFKIARQTEAAARGAVTEITQRYRREWGERIAELVRTCEARQADVVAEIARIERITDEASRRLSAWELPMWNGVSR